MRYQTAEEARISRELSRNPQNILGSANPEYRWVEDFVMAGIFLPQWFP
jgi:hypothetical protein